MRLFSRLFPALALFFLLAATARADCDDFPPDGRNRGGCNIHGCYGPGGGCNIHGCWSHGGGCNIHGCWNGPYGSCNIHGCSDYGECSIHGCPTYYPERRGRQRRHRHSYYFRYGH